MEKMMNGDGSREELEAQAQIWKYTFNYITSMSLKCAIQLGIPDIIAAHAKPLTLHDLVKALSIPLSKSPHLFRLMRMLVHSGIFAMENVSQEEQGFVLTPSSRLLLKSHETKNLSAFVVMMMDPIFVTAFHFLSDSFQAIDTSAFKIAHGMEIWNCLDQNSDANKCFNDGMASDAGFVMSVVLKNWKTMFEGFGSLVDVGGGTGTVARAISDAFPLMRLIVFDLAQVVSTMKGSKNLEFVSGDMFESIPSAEIILLKWIMHDWSDEECVKILKRCKEAISKDKGGKVMIIDIVLDEKKGKHESVQTQLCFDMLMMVLVTGKERTEAEWERLFLDAGFSRYKITPGLGLRSIIEVFP